MNTACEKNAKDAKNVKDIFFHTSLWVWYHVYFPFVISSDEDPMFQSEKLR